MSYEIKINDTKKIQKF